LRPVGHTYGDGFQDTHQGDNVVRLALLLNADVYAVLQELGAVAVEGWAAVDLSEIVAFLPEGVCTTESAGEVVKGGGGDGHSFGKLQLLE